MLDAARDLVLQSGTRAATIDRVVAASGAPKGSVYHRFATIDDLLIATWLRAVRRTQDAFLEAMRAADPVEAAVAAGLSIYDSAAAHAADARLLASVGRAELLGTATSPELRRDLADVNTALVRAVQGLAERLYGTTDRAAVDRTLFAVSDLPLGAMRRHLLAGRPFPRALRNQVERAVRAAVDPSIRP